MNKLRICVVTFPIGSSGQPTLFNLLEILEPLSDELFLITGGFNENMISDEKVHMKSVNHFIVREIVLIRAINYAWTELKICFNMCKELKKTNVVIFFLGGMTLLLPMLLAKLLGKKTILIMTGSASKSAEILYKKTTGQLIFPKILKLLENINCAISDLVVVYSEKTIDWLGLCKYKSKIYVSPRFVDTNVFRPEKKLAERKNFVGYVGELSSVKGIMNFVEAIPLIFRECEVINFLIIGRGPLEEVIAREIDDMIYPDKVTLTGFVPHDTLRTYLNELRLLVLPSYSEGLPNVVLEAMACGTPVLATPVGGVPDIVRNFETGFILKDNSPKCIAEHILKALNYSDLEKISQNAHDLIMKEYTYAVAVRRYGIILEMIEKT